MQEFSANNPDVKRRSSAEFGRIVRRTCAAFLVFIFSIPVVFSTPAATGILFRNLQVYPPLTSSMLEQIAVGPPAAIVILAAGRRTFAPEFGASYNETIDALTLERVRYGAFLARQANLPILVSGGLTPIPLSKLMAETLKTDYGLTPRWIESASRNTAENAILSSMILRRDGVRRVILVTHAWHMKRAVAAFASNGMVVTPAPTAFYSPGGRGFWSQLNPSVEALRMSGYALHEIIGGMWYRIRYGY